MTTVSITATQTPSRAMLFSGRIISGLVVTFMLVDSVMKIILHPMYVKGTTDMGFSNGSVVPIGIILMVSTILYLVPRTAFFGALLATAYLGGAAAITWQLDQPFWFPIVFAILIWFGLYLRNARLRTFVKTL